MPEQTVAVRSLEEIDKELEALHLESDLALKNKSKQALAKVKKIIAEFGFTADQVFSEVKARAQTAAKFKNPETSETWFGRGHPPKWIKGKDI